MLVVVSGASTLGEVAGVDGSHPSRLLEAYRARPASHVLLLAPWYASTMAREQAHVVIAAQPSVRICVLALPHHPLTLSLLAAVVVGLDGTPNGWLDPGEAVQLVKQAAARSRSVVWHPRVRGLHEPTPTIGQLASGLFKARGFFGEVGLSAGLTAGRSGFRPQPDEVVWTSSAPPPLLQGQLAGVAHAVFPVTLNGTRPYATKGSVELTGLVQPPVSVIRSSHCSICGTSLLSAGCAFCGSGPRALLNTPKQLPAVGPAGRLNSREGAVQ